MVFKTADVGKAAVLGFGKKRSMMELQNLQEALKVEIQIHQKLVSQMKQDPQNADLKLQLRDLQAKITALSERQKKVVEQLRRDLLVKQEDMKLQALQADGQMSTLLITQTQTPLPAASLTTSQSSVPPVIASKTLPLVLRAATSTSPIIMTPAPTITVVTTLGNTLLAGPPSSDPQKSPVNFQPVIQQTSQGAEPVRVISNSTVVVQAASQPIKVPQFVPPTRQTTRPATLPQIPAVEYGTEPKISLLNSPDMPTHSSPPLSLDTPSSPAPTNTHTSASKHQESPLKLAFMLSLGLVTRDYLEEIQSRRQERKRRTTANPIYSGAMFEPERKKSSVSYLSSINQSSRKRGRLSKNCSIVEWGPLPPTTSSHHSTFPDLQRPTAGSPFSPALSLTLPSHSPSPSPSSAGDNLQKEDAIEWPGTLAIVHSYISYKAAKEGEKDRLKRWSAELRQERETLEHQVRQLSNSITRCMDSKNSVLDQQRDMEASLEKMRGLVRLIRGIQLSPFICPGIMANGEMSHNGASKASSSSAVTTDTNNNTNTATSSSEAMMIISTLTNTSDTLNQIATNNNAEAASSKSDEGREESAQIISTSRSRSEPTNTNAAAFSNNNSNQAVLSTIGAMSAGEENTKKHKNNNNSDLSVIPQALLGPIVPLTEVTEGVK
ncbi:PHD finger protein 21Aa isoform X6 [Ctenopharyngodon idella]|uniref:PHD finger protein 21Aa isoform X6 n=1 Tax=Ctenopharyngodon idella TaxID=7959 RepID=UPI002231993E|nr:PHD finger protein 21Aa isoform X6 [Ctenopharyngodon idella]